MDWTPYINAGASALGGSVTALAVIGFFGKYLFDNWFKKGYKDWELKREEVYKQDFKRFEGKLDAMATREKTRFEQANPERIKTILDIYKTCTEIEQLLLAYGVYIGIDNSETERLRQQIYKEVQVKVSLIEHNPLRRIYFGEDLLNPLRGVTLYAVHATGKDTVEAVRQNIMKARDVIKEIEAQVRILLGTAS